jgi:hypothetical protein
VPCQPCIHIIQSFHPWQVKHSPYRPYSPTTPCAVPPGASYYHFHSLALLAPMGPHLVSLCLMWPVTAGELALLAGALPGLVELSLIE